MSKMTSETIKTFSSVIKLRFVKGFNQNGFVISRLRQLKFKKYVQRHS